MWQQDHRNGRRARSSMESSCIKNTKLEKRRREEAKREEVKEKDDETATAPALAGETRPKLVMWPISQLAASQKNIKKNINLNFYIIIIKRIIY